MQDGVGSFWKNVARGLLMAVLLNSHIELYGLSQAYMGTLVSGPSLRRLCGRSSPARMKRLTSPPPFVIDRDQSSPGR